MIQRLSVETRDGVITAEVFLPDRPVRLSELVTAFNVVTDQTTELAARDTRVSCREGCAACCRQLVPVSPPEAFRLAELVDVDLEAKFEAARERLDSSPLGRALDAPNIDERRALEIALAYPRLKLDCPFLVDERCSIYADRPAACREYLVVTPPENCTMPSPSRPLRRVPVPVQISEALARVSAEVLGGEPVTIPLPRAIAWARAHAEDGARTFSPGELVQRVADALRR
jgi:Fe-S-cluster containining protein